MESKYLPNPVYGEDRQEMGGRILLENRLTDTATATPTGAGTPDWAGGYLYHFNQKQGCNPDNA